MTPPFRGTWFRYPSQVALRLETLQRLIEGPSGDGTTGPALQFIEDGKGEGFALQLENGQKDHLFEFSKVSRRHQSPLAKFRSWSLSTSIDVDNVYIEYDEGRVQKVAEKKRAARIP
jgi:hypothetical protein